MVAWTCLFCLQNRQLVMSPVAIFCLSGIPMTPDTSSSCPKHPSSLPGTWTTSPGGAVCHSADPGVARWLPGLHPAIYACCPGPGFCIALPTLVPGVDSHMPGRELHLHDQMFQAHTCLNAPLPKLASLPCSSTFFHHLQKGIWSRFALHDHLQDKAQGFLRQLYLPRTEDPVHIRGCPWVPWGLPTWRLRPNAGRACWAIAPTPSRS